jgi:hypothetical protein
MIVKTTQELQQHIRLISSNDFDNLKPSLKRAKRYVVRVIGIESYNAALAHYNSDDYTNVHDPGYNQADASLARLDRLVDYLQDTVVFYAYHFWSPQANVVLTDSGYQVAWNDELRPAQEWQIDKAEQSILDTAHEFMDDLIEYLDSNVEHFEFWETSAEIQKSKELLINNARDFSLFLDIHNSRRLFLEIRPYIIIAESSYILPVLGREKFDELKEQVQDDDVSVENKPLLIKVRQALTFMSMYEAINALPVEVLPSGIYERFRNSTTTKSTPARLEIMNAYAAHLKEIGQLNLVRLADYLKSITEPISPDAITEDTTDEDTISKRGFFI